jgi:hypothetical protein
MARTRAAVQKELTEIRKLVKGTIKSTMNLLKIEKSLQKELIDMKEAAKRRAARLSRFCSMKSRVMRKPAKA